MLVAKAMKEYNPDSSWQKTEDDGADCRSES